MSLKIYFVHKRSSKGFPSTDNLKKLNRKNCQLHFEALKKIFGHEHFIRLSVVHKTSSIWRRNGNGLLFKECLKESLLTMEELKNVQCQKKTKSASSVYRGPLKCLLSLEGQKRSLIFSVKKTWYLVRLIADKVFCLWKS